MDRNELSVETTRGDLFITYIVLKTILLLLFQKGRDLVYERGSFYYIHCPKNNFVVVVSKGEGSCIREGVVLLHTLS